jgi:outer membrane protein OmpA-like peptidoglycan-associated protein
VPQDTTGPELEVTLSVQYFSPDNDGDNDELAITLKAVDAENAVAGWTFEIHEPQPPYNVFFQWSGEGAPTEAITWDGRNTEGELVQSASEYPYTFNAEDSLGNASKLEGNIEVDVLVIREGDNLRVQVPSIVFGKNSGGFDGLEEEIAANNDWILRRIAAVLAKFDTYQVKVEGHANPTENINAKTAAARRRAENEQKKELQPLSEKRAEAVVDYLVELGIERERLSSFGIGGARTVVPFEDKDNWWKNRRVEFLLVKPEVKPVEPEQVPEDIPEQTPEA